jgi:glycosyltransferase involved in cell wall biosynthesis
MADPAPGGGQRPPVSAVVTTFNEEHNLGDCLASLEWCEEIVVVDSFSTDRTPEIARACPKARFFQRPYYGSASAKNFGIDQTRHDWILVFDADERCTPRLQAEMERELLAPRAEVYVIKRRVYFMDRVIRFSGWQRDRVVRLFRRDAARYPNRRVHADMVTRSRPLVLREPMLHFMIDRFEAYVPRVVKYGVWGAAQAWRRGRRTNVLEVLLRPLWRFLRMYVFQLGILDGTAGAVFCALQAFATYTKWATLWAWRHDAKRGRTPKLPPFDEDQGTWEFPAGEGAGESGGAAALSEG